MPALSLGAVLVPLGFLVSLMPQIPSGLALLGGAMVSMALGNPWLRHTQKLTRPLLSTAIVGLGAGMNLLVVAENGYEGFGFTLASLALTLVLGWTIGKALGTSRDLSILISVGTAICGGSAIAAVSSAIRAKSEDTTVALAIVFVLNGIALFAFPFVGHQFHLTEYQFGLWSALAIHDTSSVVGATIQFGPKAVEVGTTVKLVRALWIIPVTLLVAKFVNRSTENKKTQFPFFILGFIVISAIVTWLPELHDVGSVIEAGSKRLLVGTLFLIGSGTTMSTIKTPGYKSFLQGVVLWVVVASASLAFIVLL